MPMRQLEKDTSTLPENWRTMADWRVRVLGETDAESIDYLVRALRATSGQPPTINATITSEIPAEIVYLYRYYDAEGELLYIGITGNLSKRESWHRKYSPWWSLVGEKTIERHDSRISAREAELQAIQFEDPIHNIEGKQKP